MSIEATTTEAPGSSISAAWTGPASTATVRALQRSAAKAEGSVASGGTNPLEVTSTPTRLEMRPPYAAITAGSALAGTARHTMSWPSGFSSAARITRTVSGKRTPGR